MLSLAGLSPDLRVTFFTLVEQVAFVLLADKACFAAELAVEVDFLDLATVEEVFAEEVRVLI